MDAVNPALAAIPRLVPAEVRLPSWAATRSQVVAGSTWHEVLYWRAHGVLVHEIEGPGKDRVAYSVYFQGRPGQVDGLVGEFDAIVDGALYSPCKHALDRLARRVQGLDTRRYMRSRRSFLQREARGLGVAAAIYTRVLAMAARLGLAAGPDACAEEGETSADALRLWDRLAAVLPSEHAVKLPVVHGGPLLEAR